MTGANPDNTDNIVLDEYLMDRVGLWTFDKVLVCEVTNGNCFETYAIAGERWSGVCLLRGAATLRSAKGNCLIIMSFDVADGPVDPQMILVDEQNRFVEYLSEVEHDQ